MDRFRLRRPSASMTVAFVALMVALGGSSYAALKLPKNSVGSKQIRKNAVTSSKIKKNAVTSGKVKNGSLLGVDFKAGQLPAGPKGDKGDKGATGAPGAPGAPGTALAYAAIDATAVPTADPARSKVITSANLSDLGTGGTCISGLPFTPKNVVATLSNFDVGENTAGVAPNIGACPAGTQVRVTTYDSAGAVVDGSDFSVLVN